MRDLLTTDISILGAPLVVTGLARLWGAARASNYLGPFFNIVISNVPGPRQTLYCAGAPATHYFPVSIPYHGCALNITAQSYLDQLDFGLVACSQTVPDAQRIADFIVEDFAAMREADAELSGPRQSRRSRWRNRPLPPRTSPSKSAKQKLSSARRTWRRPARWGNASMRWARRPRLCSSGSTRLSRPLRRGRKRRRRAGAPYRSRALGNELRASRRRRDPRDSSKEAGAARVHAEFLSAAG